MARVRVILKDGTPVDADNPLPVVITDAAITIDSVDLDVRNLEAAKDTVNVAMNGVTVDETHPIAVMVPGRVGIEGGNTTPVSVTLGAQIIPVEQRPTRDPPADHRASISTPDKLVSSTPTGADQAGQAGTLTAVAHGIAVAAMNDYGVATPVFTASSVTPTVSKSIDVGIPQVAGATKYKVFLSTSTTAPQWVGTITEAQRAAGCSITAVGVIGAAGPGGANKVNVQCVGTGLACTDPIFTNNNAYTPDVVVTPITVQRNSVWLYIDVVPTALGTTKPTLVLIPFFSRNEEAGIYYQGLPVTIKLLSENGACLRQAYKLECEGNKYVKCLLNMTGCSTSITSERV